MKTHLKRRLFALVLCVALLLSCMPITAFADSANEAIAMIEGDVIADFADAGAECPSTDPSVAWVDEDGALNAMKPGTAVITNDGAEYEVTVSDYEDGSPVVGSLKLLARFNDSMQFYDGHVYLLFTSYQDGVEIKVPDLYAGYEIDPSYYYDIREDISVGSNHTGKDADTYFTFNDDMDSVTLNRGEIVTIGMYRDFDLSVPQAALGSIKNSSLWAGLTAAGKATVVEALFKLLDDGAISAEDALARFQAVLAETGLDYNKLIDGVVDGGVCFNRELYNQKLEWDQYENVTYKMDITEKQLEAMVASLGGNFGKFSILKNSCATVALGAWNAAVGMRDGEQTAHYMTSSSDGIFKVIDAPKGVRDNIVKRLPGYYLNNKDGVAEPDAGYQDDTGWVYVSAPEKVAPAAYHYTDETFKIYEALTPLTTLINAASAGQDVAYNKDSQEIGVCVQQNDGVIGSVDFEINGKTVSVTGENLPEGELWLTTKVENPAEGESYYVSDADGKALASAYDPESGEMIFRVDTLPQSYRIVSGAEGTKNILMVDTTVPEGADISAEVYYKGEGGVNVTVDGAAEIAGGTKVYVKPAVADDELTYYLNGISFDYLNILDEEHYDAEEGAYYGIMPDHFAGVNLRVTKAEIEAVDKTTLQVCVGDTLVVEDYAHLFTDEEYEAYVLDEMKWKILLDDNGVLSADGGILTAEKKGEAIAWACLKANDKIGVPFVIDVIGDRADYVSVVFDKTTEENCFVHADDAEPSVLPCSGYLVPKGTQVALFPKSDSTKAPFAVVCNGEALTLAQSDDALAIAYIPADSDLDITARFVDAEIKDMPKEVKLETAEDTYQLKARMKYKSIFAIVAPYDERVFYTSSNPLVKVDKNGLITLAGEIPEGGDIAYITAYSPTASGIKAMTKVTVGDYDGNKIVGRLTISARPITQAQLIAHGAVTFTPYEDMDLPVSYYRYYKPNEKYDALLKDYAEHPENYSSDPALYNDNELGLEDRESYFDVIEGSGDTETISLKAGESITMSNYGYDNARVDSILSVLENSTISSSKDTQALIEQLHNYNNGEEVDTTVTFDSLAATLVQIVAATRQNGYNPADGRSEGGLDINREMYNQFIRPDSQLPNNYYTVDLTADELEMMTAYISDPDNNYYSLMNKNCATGAVDIWNATLADKPELQLTGNYTGIAVEPESLYIELGRLANKQDLDGESGKDFYPRSVAHPMSYSELIDAIDKLGEPELTDEYMAQLDELRVAYEDLNDTEKSLVTNSDKLEAAEKAYDDLKYGPMIEEFEAYKAEKLAQADALLKEDDSMVSRGIAAIAKAAISGTEYDRELPLEQNKATLDAILATLDRTLIAQRAIEHPILGDINYSGEVEIVDVTYLQRSLAGIEVPFIINDFVADVDYDNNISILDASYIQRWLEGMDSVEGIGEPI